MDLRMICKRIIVCALLLFIGAAAGCQKTLALDPAKLLTQYTHDVWTNKSEFPQSGIGAIAQTADGYLWLGSQTGLVRFDGVKFTEFNRTNTPEITHPAILSLRAARDGSLWFGTFGGGLTHYKDGRFKTYTTRDGLSNNVVYSIVERADGDLWIGTVGGLNHFQNEKFTVYTVRDGLPHNLVTSIAEDAHGGLWLGTQEGLCLLKNERFKTFDAPGGMRRSYVLALSAGRDGSLWIGTKNDGLYQHQNGHFRHFGTRENLSNNSVRSLAEDRAGNLWVGTEAGGLNRLRADHFDRLTTADGLTANYIGAIYEDREGSLWLGTNAGGLNRLRDSKFTAFTAREGLAGDTPESIYQDRTGAVWIGTANGVSRYHNGKFTNFTQKNGLSSNFVTSILEDRRGAIWIGTSGGGLNRYANGKFQNFTVRDGLSSNVILTVYEDRAGVLWLAAEGGGVNFYKNGKFGGYSALDGLSSNSARDIYEDQAGNLWIATVDGGINKFKNGRFTIYTSRDGLSDDTVLKIYEDADGVLWLGTQAGGLNRFENGKFTIFDSRNGLVDDVIGTILEDDAGNLWLGGEKGVHSVKKSELNEFAQGAIERVAHRSYDTTDGMRSSTGRTHSKPGGCKTADGRLWFPTQKGVIVIDPAHIQFNQEPPPIYLESIAVDKKPLALEQENIRLPAETADFEFNYTALSFLVPDKVRFRYQLEGFDKDWVEADQRRTAYYTNLPPGAYRFRIIAANNDGVWNQTGASFAFYLQPHFYETGWFYVLCAALLAAAGYGIYEMRVRAMRREFSVVLAERNRISRELHDTVAQEVAGISAQLEAFKAKRERRAPEAEKHLDRARHLAQQCLNDARRFVRNLRPQTIESGNLMNALAFSAEQAAADAATQINLEVTGAPRKLSEVVEMNLLRIGQEALANAVKHARANRIDIELEYRTECIELRVRDNGSGFVPHRKTKRNNNFGIVGMQERAHEINGKLSIRSSLHEGTEVSALVPMR